MKSIYFGLFCISGLITITTQAQASVLLKVAADGSTNFKTLSEAYDAIPQPTTDEYDIALDASKGDVFLGNPTSSSASSLNWIKAGSERYPIKIFSINGRATVKPAHSLLNITFQNVSWIDIRGIDFNSVNPSDGIKLDNADHMTIQYNKFIGAQVPLSTGGAGMWIGQDQKWSFDKWNNAANLSSENNNISYNHFSGSSIDSYCKPNDGNHVAEYQGIYISYGSIGNTIAGNTIINAPGSGIAFNHGYQKNNTVKNNIIQVDYTNVDNTSYANCGPTNSSLKYGNHYDVIQNSRYGINFNNQDASSNGTIVDNRINDNYITLTPTVSIFPNVNVLDNSQLIAPNHTLALRAVNELLPNNTVVNQHYYNNDKTLKDPYWIKGFNPSFMKDIVVSGDFNNDGKVDDIAFFDIGNNGTNSSKIHVFTSSVESTLTFLGVGWDSSGFNRERILGRVVSGDFDGDGYQDDIAVFCQDWNLGEDRINLFLGDGKGKFIYVSNAWASTGYSVENITGRVVSGDFDGDGYKDDIAVFYQDWNPGEDRINLFIGSKAAKFTYVSSAWASTGYSVENITGRVVSGDFDGDGYEDDIAAFYEKWNPGEDRINVFIGNPTTKFTYVSNAWAATSYSVRQITGRVTSGDFDGDGSKDDIAAFYQNWLPGENRINMFKGNGALGFDVQTNWWSTKSYDFNKITGLIVSGNFGGPSCSNGIVSLYGYGDNNMRTHAWCSNTNSFNFINDELGMPWLYP